jgi:predicted nucleotidyltransferase
MDFGKMILDILILLVYIHNMNLANIPEKYRLDIEKATVCLKEEGCSAIFLFGSLVTGKYVDTSDIDFGIMGLSPRKFIPTYSKLNNLIDSRFDLIDFDENIDLYNLLYSIGEVEKIG